jgi:predicted acyl esterase
MLTSNVFRAGHQIRIQISGAFFPHFSRNLQSGESEVTSSAMCPAHVRIHLDPDHRSRIELPIIPR